MRLFQIAGVMLAVIAGFNLIHVSVQWALQDKVYACSEVTKDDPINVQKKCRKV